MCTYRQAHGELHRAGQNNNDILPDSFSEQSDPSLALDRSQLPLLAEASSLTPHLPATNDPPTPTYQTTDSQSVFPIYFAGLLEESSAGFNFDTVEDYWLTNPDVCFTILLSALTPL